MRERNGMSLLDLSNATRMSVGYLSRLENGHREPTLAALRRIAAVVDREPMVVFVHQSSRVLERYEAMCAQSPMRRLYDASAFAFDAIVCLRAALGDAVVVSGAAAAVAQGLPLPVDDVLAVVVRDDDEVITRLVEVLMRQFALYRELSPDEYRRVPPRAWPIAGCDVTVILAAAMPATVAVDLGDCTVGMATLPELVRSDEKVAEVFRQVGMADTA